MATLHDHKKEKPALMDNEKYKANAQLQIPRRIIAVLITRGSFSAEPLKNIGTLAKNLSDSSMLEKAVVACIEQGEPSLFETLISLRDTDYDEILLIPVSLPMEPSTRNWITRAISSWKNEYPGDWPLIRMSSSTLELEHLNTLLSQMVSQTLNQPPLAEKEASLPKADIVNHIKQRVLVCRGTSCENAGASHVWRHFKEKEKKQKLTAEGNMRSVRTSCLGPCYLGPVIQVYPEGTYYCGATTKTVDKIIESHILEGKIVDKYAYEPSKTKQALRG